MRPKPQQLALNCNSSLVAVIDAAGVLTVQDLEANVSQRMILRTTLRTIPIMEASTRPKTLIRPNPVLRPLFGRLCCTYLPFRRFRSSDNKNKLIQSSPPPKSPGKVAVSILSLAPTAHMELTICPLWFEQDGSLSYFYFYIVYTSAQNPLQSPYVPLSCLYSVSVNSLPGTRPKGRQEENRWNSDPGPAWRGGTRGTSSGQTTILTRREPRTQGSETTDAGHIKRRGAHCHAKFVASYLDYRRNQACANLKNRVHLPFLCLSTWDEKPCNPYP